MSAHWTWFTAPGWTLLLEGRGSGRLSTCGTFVSLMGPAGEVTTIVETLECYTTAPLQAVTLQLPVAIKSLAAWISNSSHLLAPLPDVVASGAGPGQFTLRVAAGSMYTFTSERFSVPLDSIANQRIGLPGQAAPPARPFPLPFQSDFTKCVVDSSPPYMMSSTGSFTCWEDPSGQRVLRQWVQQPPVRWHYYDAEPTMLFGPGYSNYQVTVQAMLPSPARPARNPFRVSVCAVRTLNATGQSRVTL